MRFPEFKDEWNIVKVSDLLEFYSTNSYSWDQLDFEAGEIFNLHYGMIHNGLPTMMNAKENILPFVKEKPKNYTICKEGDVAFADASEDTNDVAKCIEFTNCDRKQIICGLHTIHGRDKLGITELGYKGYAFSSKAFHDQVKKLAQGTKIYSISAKTFSECFVGIPSNKEQQKIAKLLSLLDKRIEIQKSVIEKLKSLKSAIVDQMIKKNIVLSKDFKVSEIAEIGRGRVISTKEISSQQNPKFPVYSSQTSNNGVMGYLDDYSFDGEFITWTTDGANAGTVFYRNGKFNCTNVCGVLKLKKDFDAYYVSHILQRATHAYVSTNLANPKLMNNTMAQVRLSLPPYEVQIKWSKLLRKIDNKLNIIEIMLSQYQDQKKFLLSKMFI